MFNANSDAHWIFGIDGLPKDSHKYRINQDGEFLFRIMKMAKDQYKINCTWQYIIFDYNEEDVFDVMAKNLGVSFSTIETQRGKDETKEYEFKPQCLNGKEIFSTSGTYYHVVGVIIIKMKY